MKKVFLLGCKAIFVLFMFSLGTFLAHPSVMDDLRFDLITSIKKTVWFIKNLIAVFLNYLINFL